MIKYLLTRVFLGLQFRLLLLVVLACAPLVALTLHAAWADRRRQMSNWLQRSHRMMQVAKQEEDEFIDGTRQLLLAIAESSSVRANNRNGCKKLLDELCTTYPRYANLGVIQTNGEVLATAVPLAESAVTNRQFFRRALQTHGFAIGHIPAAGVDGADTLNFSHPVFNRSGEIQAVVFAALDLRRFSHFDPQMLSQLPKGAVWTEFDRSGTLLARYPAPADWNRRPRPEQSLLKAAMDGEDGMVDTLFVDGAPWVYASVFMPSRLVADDVITILAIPKHVLFAQADAVLLRNLSWSGLALSLALALGWLGSKFLVLRPVKALVRSSARLAAGDLSARTGLAPGWDELGQLTRAFDKMAQALEQREKERLRASQKLQVLSHRLVEVQETERRHIARELHDEIGQSLTVAELNLQAALQSPAPESLERRLEDSIQAVERVLEQVHDLSLNLRPSMLDDLGLEPALRWYTQRQAALTGLQTCFRADPLEERLDPLVETECFRVAQEALTNVARHAQARAVAVELSKKDGHLHLTVRDDGIGFNVSVLRDHAVNGASLGLLSMEERAALAGGGLEYISAPGHGTEVHAWFPLKLKALPTCSETNE